MRKSWIGAAGVLVCVAPVLAQDTDQAQLERMRTEARKLFRQGKFADAIALYQQAVELDPLHADTWFHYGQVFHQQGKLDDAIARYSKAIEALSGHHKAYHNRGVARWQKGDLEAALEDLDEAVKVGSTYPEAWNSRASLLASMGRLDEALSDASEAIRIAERHNDTRERKTYYVPAYHTRAIVELQLGKLDQAQADLEFACEQEPGLAAYKLRLGVTAFRRGDQKGAVASYDAALAVARGMELPEGKRAAPLNDYLRARCLAGRGQAKFLLGDKEGALADLQASCQYTPDHVYTPLWIHGLGGETKDLARLAEHAYEQEEERWIQEVLLFYLGKKSEEDVFKAAASPEDAEAKQRRLCQAHCYRALLAERAGDVALARKHYEQTLVQKVFGYTEHWWAKHRLAQLGK